jgi:hypothetical protein
MRRRSTRTVVDAFMESEVARRLKRGDSNLAIARELDVDYSVPREMRSRLGLPVFQRGPMPAADSWEQALEDRVLATQDGHAHWTGPEDNGTPVMRWRGRHTTAARAVFEQHYGREAVGKVRQTCESPQCVKGEHLEDRLMRDQRRAREEGAGRVAA